MFCKRSTGHVLNLDFEIFFGIGETYHVFESMSEATEFANNKLEANLELEFHLMKEDGTEIEKST